MEENSQYEGLPEETEDVDEMLSPTKLPTPPLPTKLPTKLPTPPLPTTDFIPSQSFSGERSGYVFKMDTKGIGYYADHHGFQMDGFQMDGFPSEPRRDDRHVSFSKNEILIYNPQETPNETGTRNRNRTKI
jgi:hypothetical protein